MAQKRVLIVDDEENIGRSLRLMISSIVSRIGVSEFLTSCAILRARACQLARRVTWIRRSRACWSWPAMWLKAWTAAPISSDPPGGTRAARSPAATRPRPCVNC